jgi:membrane protease YdiL (CAAX protease family)
LKIQLTKLAEYPAPLRILLFLLLLSGLWLPLALPIALLSRDSNQTTIWVMLLLVVEFVWLMRWWGRQIYHEQQIFQVYGLTLSQQNWREGLKGFNIGLISLMLMFVLQGLCGWLTWATPTPALLPIALEGLLVALAVGIAEELVFRGWILNELQREYSPVIALWLTSCFYAALHFIKPLPEVLRTLPQFPGLVLIGLICVWMKQSTRSLRRTSVSLTTQPGRLGLPIGFHAGIVWGYYLLKVGQLVQLTNRAPEWVTGIDGNPLSGVVGLLFLIGLALYWRKQAI